MSTENLYVLIRVVFPKLDRVFPADVNVHTATFAVILKVVRISVWIILNFNEAVSERSLVFAGKGFEELNDFVVNEQAIFHDFRSSSERFNRRSRSSKVANSDPGLSIFSASFLR
jgi:hypothetical protein